MKIAYNISSSGGSKWSLQMIIIIIYGTWTNKCSKKKTKRLFGYFSILVGKKREANRKKTIIVTQMMMMTLMKMIIIKPYNENCNVHNNHIFFSLSIYIDLGMMMGIQRKNKKWFHFWTTFSYYIFVYGFYYYYDYKS